MSSSVIKLLHHYKTTKEHNLSKFYGILHIDNIHFIGVFIDIEHCTVETCDSYHIEKGITKSNQIQMILLI